MNFPKISIVTPSYNQGEYLEETILSILEQNYPNLEYIIIDGGSTDNSVEIIKKFENRLSFWISEKDNGLYDALQKGFAKSSGEIMGWLNSDDLLHRKSLFTVAEILSLEGVDWIQGQPTFFDEQSRTINVQPNAKWSKYRYYLDDFKWIQQESTYWTRNLWTQAGGYISVKYKYAGDLELWNRFFKYEKLYTPDCLIGGFRMRTKNQLSLEKMAEYQAEARKILKDNVIDEADEKIVRKIKKNQQLLRLIHKTGVFSVAYLTSGLQNKINSLYNFPATINYSREEQKFFL